MPFRHRYATVTWEGKDFRLGPYASRRMAERMARELFTGAPVGQFVITYEVDRRRLRHGRS
jgi:hypothetical protein